MRKKELRARSEMLRRELAKANALAASQVKRLNELRMTIAFLEGDREIEAEHNGHGGGQAAGSPSAVAEPDLKACPDCAEHVRSAARKCRYCGYRFDGVERDWVEHGPVDGTTNGSAPITRLGTVSGR